MVNVTERLIAELRRSFGRSGGLPARDDQRLVGDGAGGGQIAALYRRCEGGETVAQIEAGGVCRPLQQSRPFDLGRTGGSAEERGIISEKR